MNFTIKKCIGMLNINTLLMLLFVCSSILFSAHAYASSGQGTSTLTSGNSYTITPPTSNDVLLNPGKGWVLYGSPKNQTASTMANATVGYERYNWSAIEPTEGHYNWSLIDDDLNAWHAAGKEFAFGVMSANSSNSNIKYITPKWVLSEPPPPHTKEPPPCPPAFGGHKGARYIRSHTFDETLVLTGIQYVPVWDDPFFLRKLESFVKALAQRYDGNPHIAFIDIRSYGNWGAENVYGLPCSKALSPSGVQKHIQIYMNAFKHTQLIVPWGRSDYSKVYTNAVKQGIGLRTDSVLGASNGSELADAYGKTPTVMEFHGGYQWLIQHANWSNSDLLAAVNAGKPSYIGMGLWGNDAQEMLAHEPQLIYSLANTMGYYFFLSSATLPSLITNNQNTTLSLSWKNQGVAYLDQKASVAVALLDGSNNVIQKQWLTNVNPRTWTPGKTVITPETVKFENVASGTYKLAVGLFAQTTDSDPTYKIGNQGRTDNGWYVLGNSTIVNTPTGTWTRTGSLLGPRGFYTMTRLLNGKVLVAGGINNSNVTLASAEIYDPATRAWTSTGSMVVPRSFHTATLLPNGKVLVVGGENRNVTLASAELYDPATGTWTTTGAMLTPRSSHTATLLLSTGKVLVVGGYGKTNAAGTVELYDPATGAWTTTGSLSTPRWGQWAIQLPNDKVLIAGGQTYTAALTRIALETAELYDPATGTWTTAGAMSDLRFADTATLLPNGKVLVVGGSNGTNVLRTAELYDPATGTWTTTGALTRTRTGHVATLLPNGKVLVAGGGDWNPTSGNVTLASAEIYDPANGTWTSTGGMAAPRWGQSAILLSTGKVLIAGGSVDATAAGVFGTAELYDPEGIQSSKPTWTPTNSLPTGK